MKDQETIAQFIHLRASGLSYDKIAAQLNVSKPTLIQWSRKYQFEIQNLHAIELEALREKWLASTTDRVNALGEQLRRVQGELEKRDLSTLSTPQLMSAARNLQRQIEQATGPLQFTVPLNDIPAEEQHEHVHDWKA